MITMGNIVFAGIAPHPPIIVDQVGGGKNREVEKTIAAMSMWAKKLKEARPDLLIIITPHGNLFKDAIAIHGNPILKGDFSNFGVRGTIYEFKNHEEIKKQIILKAKEKGYSMVEVNDSSIYRYGLKKELDHGVLVPLHFLLKEGFNVPLVVLSMSLLENLELYKFGMLIEEVIANSQYNAALVASGDLSHRLTRTAPAGFDPAGKDFDMFIVEKAKSGQLIEVMDIDEELVERAGECGLRPIIMLAGALDKYKVASDIISYEGPYGVGYLVASFNLEKINQSNLAKWKAKKNENLQEQKNNESLPVKLARESLTYFLETGKYLSVPKPLPELLKEKKACFVSLKKHGGLRGCIGTIEPVRETLAEEIIENSVSAGVRDPRFLPVTRDELDDIVFSVDVLSKPEKISSKEELDPINYGIIVKSGRKSGVLLPNLEGVDTVEKQLKITLDKAGIRPEENYTIYRFKVDRYY